MKRFTLFSLFLSITFSACGQEKPVLHIIDTYSFYFEVIGKNAEVKRMLHWPHGNSFPPTILPADTLRLRKLLARPQLRKLLPARARLLYSTRPNAKGRVQVFLLQTSRASTFSGLQFEDMKPYEFDGEKGIVARMSCYTTYRLTLFAKMVFSNRLAVVHRGRVVGTTYIMGPDFDTSRDFEALDPTDIDLLSDALAPCCTAKPFRPLFHPHYQRGESYTYEMTDDDETRSLRYRLTVSDTTDSLTTFTLTPLTIPIDSTYEKMEGVDLSGLPDSVQAVLVRTPFTCQVDREGNFMGFEPPEAPIKHIFNLVKQRLQPLYDALSKEEKEALKKDPDRANYAIGLLTETLISKNRIEGLFGGIDRIFFLNDKIEADSLSGHIFDGYDPATYEVKTADGGGWHVTVITEGFHDEASDIMNYGEVRAEGPKFRTVYTVSPDGIVTRIALYGISDKPFFILRCIQSP